MGIMQRRSGHGWREDMKIRNLAWNTLTLAISVAAIGSIGWALIAGSRWFYYALFR